MKTTLRTNITVRDICDGFVYNELEGKGLFGLGGKLTIQQGIVFEDAKKRTLAFAFHTISLYNVNN